MSEPKVFTLAELCKATDAACELASMNWKAIGGAVNWADLSCAVSERFETSDGDHGFRVYVEEAAPNEQALCDFIAAELKQKGFGDVEVVTEW